MTLRVLMLATVVAALGLGGCSRMRDTQGYLADEELLAAVQPGVDNKESVAQALGRPSIASEWDDRAWYYVTRETRQLAFTKPRAIDQTILKISFDEAGTVTNVERRGLEQVASIDPSEDETPTLGRDQSILDAIFGNIGRVGSGPVSAAPPQ